MPDNHQKKNTKLAYSEVIHETDQPEDNPIPKNLYSSIKKKQKKEIFHPKLQTAPHPNLLISNPLVKIQKTSQPYSIKKLG